MARKNKTPRVLHKFWVFYDQYSLICYTIIFPNGDLWGCSRKIEEPAGYGGNVLEVEGWKSIYEYIKDKRSHSRKIGIELRKDSIPEDVTKWIEQLIKIHGYGK